jgi:putative endonuclease
VDNSGGNVDKRQDFLVFNQMKNCPISFKIWLKIRIIKDILSNKSLNMESVKTQKKEVGEKGENLACKFLKEKGFEILDRNYRQKWGELDIIARQDNWLHFVEVKTVTRRGDFAEGNSDGYEPEENIHRWKRERLARTIETYLLAKKVSEDVDWQVDAIAVYLNEAGDLLKIDWLEDIML